MSRNSGPGSVAHGSLRRRPGHLFGDDERKIPADGREARQLSGPGQCARGQGRQVQLRSRSPHHPGPARAAGADAAGRSSRCTCRRGTHRQSVPGARTRAVEARYSRRRAGRGRQAVEVTLEVVEIGLARDFRPIARPPASPWIAAARRCVSIGAPPPALAANTLPSSNRRTRVRPGGRRCAAAPRPARQQARAHHPEFGAERIGQRHGAFGGAPLLQQVPHRRRRSSPFPGNRARPGADARWKPRPGFPWARRCAWRHRAAWSGMRS